MSEKNSYLKTVMDFAFFDRINQAKNEETDGWWQGFNRIYNALCSSPITPGTTLTIASAITAAANSPPVST